MEKLTSKFTPRKKVGERNYWVDLIAKLVDRRIPHIAKLLEGLPTTWIKDGYLSIKSEKNPAACWWIWYEGTKEKQKPLV